MKMQNPHNTEASVTRQSKIEDCLLECMEQTPYAQITVADMCRRMSISRRLYYTYFPDKESCLISLIDRMLLHSMSIMPTEPLSQDDSLKYAVLYLQYWKDHGDFLDAIVEQKLTGRLFDRLFFHIQTNGDFYLPLLNSSDVQADDTILWIFTAIRISVLLQWQKLHYATPVEEMALKCLRIMKQPIIQE